MTKATVPNPLMQIPGFKDPQVPTQSPAQAPSVFQRMEQERGQAVESRRSLAQASGQAWAENQFYSDERKQEYVASFPEQNSFYKITGGPQEEPEVWQRYGEFLKANPDDKDAWRKAEFDVGKERQVQGSIGIDLKEYEAKLDALTLKGHSYAEAAQILEKTEPLKVALFSKIKNDMVWHVVPLPTATPPPFIQKRPDLLEQWRGDAGFRLDLTRRNLKGITDIAFDSSSGFSPAGDRLNRLVQGQVKYLEGLQRQYQNMNFIQKAAFTLKQLQLIGKGGVVSFFDADMNLAGDLFDKNVKLREDWIEEIKKTVKELENTPYLTERDYIEQVKPLVEMIDRSTRPGEVNATLALVDTFSARLLSAGFRAVFDKELIFHETPEQVAAARGGTLAAFLSPASAGKGIVGKGLRVFRKPFRVGNKLADRGLKLLGKDYPKLQVRLGELMRSRGIKGVVSRYAIGTGESLIKGYAGLSTATLIGNVNVISELKRVDNDVLELFNQRVEALGETFRDPGTLLMMTAFALMGGHSQQKQFKAFMGRDLYKDLGVKSDATRPNIQAADSLWRAGQKNRPTEAKAQQKHDLAFENAKRAFDILKNPALRKIYDRYGEMGIAVARKEMTTRIIQREAEVREAKADKEIAARVAESRGQKLTPTETLTKAQAARQGKSKVILTAKETGERVVQDRKPKPLPSSKQLPPPPTGPISRVMPKPPVSPPTVRQVPKPAPGVQEIVPETPPAVEAVPSAGKEVEPVAEAPIEPVVEKPVKEKPSVEEPRQVSRDFAPLKHQKVGKTPGKPFGFTKKEITDRSDPRNIEINKGIAGKQAKGKWVTDGKWVLLTKTDPSLKSIPPARDQKGLVEMGEVIKDAVGEGTPVLVGAPKEVGKVRGEDAYLLETPSGTFPMNVEIYNWLVSRLKLRLGKTPTGRGFAILDNTGETVGAVMPFTESVEGKTFKLADEGKIGAPSGSAMAAIPSEAFQDQTPKAKHEARVDQREVVKEEAETVKEVKTRGQAVKDLLAPSTAAIQKKITKGILREGQAVIAHRLAQGQEALKGMRKMFNKMPIEAKHQTMYDIEEGKAQASPELEPFARLSRESLDGRRTEVQNLGRNKLQEYIENYFPHIVKQPGKLKQAIRSILSKKKLAGSATFLKHRKIPTIRELHKLGFELETDNPAELLLLRLHDMDKYIIGQRMFSELQERGMAKFVYITGKGPEGYVAINDPIATRYGPPEMDIAEAFDEQVMTKLVEFGKSLDVNFERKVRIGGRNRWGYAKGQHEITTKTGGPESVIAHELGHILDVQYELQEKWNLRHGRDEFNNQLRDLADMRFEGKEDVTGVTFKKYVRKGGEKVATMLQAYIHVPEKMKQVAPLVYKEFSKFIKERPELKELDQIRPSLVLGSRVDKVKIPGLTIIGRYWVPEPVGNILNKHLSPGLRGKPWFDIARYSGNILNQAQLGLSFFHGTFTAITSIESQFTLAFEQASRGQILKGLKTFALAHTVIHPIIRGFQKGIPLRTAYKKTDQALTDPVMREMVEALTHAGGRVGMDSIYHNSAIASFMDSLRKTGELKGGKKIVPALGVAVKSLPAALEGAARPLMAHLVPVLKLGAFYDLARLEMETLPPDASTELVRETLWKAWDSIDNRFGLVVYDNIFWNRTMKDISFLLVRALGWTRGTIKEIGGGIVDATVTPVRVARGEHWLTHRMAYILGLVYSTGLIGSIIMYFMTGKLPEEPRDALYPKIGGKNPDGTDRRIKLPTYLAEAHAYYDEPLQTAKNKTHPLIRYVGDMLENKDFYNTEIRHTDDPIADQLKDSFAFALKQFEPLSFRNYRRKKDEGESTPSAISSFFGVMPAPARGRKTAAMRKMTDYIVAKIPQGTRTKEQFELSKWRRNLVVRAKGGEDISGELKDALKSGKLTNQQVGFINRAIKGDPMLLSFNRLSQYEARMVWGLANKEEKKLWKPLLLKKHAAGLTDKDTPISDQQEIIGFLGSIEVTKAQIAESIRLQGKSKQWTRDHLTRLNRRWTE